jgi:hypothetical protein
VSLNPYHKEQIDALTMVRRHLQTLSPPEIIRLEQSIADYLSFRKAVDIFLGDHFSDICDRTCFQNRLSVCCSREGIITFFADMVINALCSRQEDLDRFFEVLEQPNHGFKCVYLGEEGCLWKIKPIVCEMFLCDQAETSVFGRHPDARQKWHALKEQGKSFKWPDRPVLFDELEQYFLDAGLESPLMYLHNSPGLLRVKKQAE